MADSGGIEQPNGSFLHQRIHPPDPLPPVTRVAVIEGVMPPLKGYKCLPRIVPGYDPLIPWVAIAK